ncbi:MAG: hypothetical protein WDM78_15745 [Puia sp.]
MYIQLKPGVDYKTLETKLPVFANKYINSQEWAVKNNHRSELHLIPLSDIHLNSNYNQEAEVNGNGRAVAFLFLIAIFIICIAWINYINLATARSVEESQRSGCTESAWCTSWHVDPSVPDGKFFAQWHLFNSFPCSFLYSVTSL